MTENPNTTVDELVGHFNQQLDKIEHDKRSQATAAYIMKQFDPPHATPIEPTPAYALPEGKSEEVVISRTYVMDNDPFEPDSPGCLGYLIYIVIGLMLLGVVIMIVTIFMSQIR